MPWRKGRVTAQAYARGLFAFESSLACGVIAGPCAIVDCMANGECDAALMACLHETLFR
jgi:hypothetical protein